MRLNPMRALLVFVVLLSACSPTAIPEQERAAGDVASHRLGWEQLRLFDYTWTYKAGTYWDFGGEITVTVERGQVVAVDHEDPGPRPVHVLTAVDLFDVAADALGGDGWNATFHPASCLPTSMRFDERADVADDEYTFELIAFTPASGPDPVSCKPVEVAAHCPDLTGSRFAAEQAGPTVGGGSRRPSLEFTARDTVEFTGSDYIEEIRVRCEAGALTQVEQWARLDFEDDIVVIERGRDRLLGSLPTGESACAALVGGYASTGPDPWITELDVAPRRITYRLGDGTIHTLAYECVDDAIYRLYERGRHLADGRVLFDGGFFTEQVP